MLFKEIIAVDSEKHINTKQRVTDCWIRWDIYEGESNENRKTEKKIRNIAPLSCKLADMLPML
jgi:hypothetical protein